MSFNDAENAWDAKAKELQRSHPLKILRHLPSVPGITEETAKHLKWKSLKYLIRHDKKKVLSRNLLKHPLKYTFGFLRSFLKKKPYIRDGDFFLYGLKDVESFRKELKNPSSLLVLGFSYCHKPHECPSKRFTPDCINDPQHPVCGQCFIGKSLHLLGPNKARVLIIPTIHYIGEKIFDIVNANPKRKVLFLITACELTLEMFGDFGNMVGASGIGVRLDGRVCNTMEAFELSEAGIKPGLTVVLPTTQKRILELLALCI